MNYWTTSLCDADIEAAIDFVAADDVAAAGRLLDAFFETFDLLARFPQAGPSVGFQEPRLRAVRFFVVRPPFNRWLAFYVPEGRSVRVLRVLHGAMDWREGRERFF